MKEINKGLQQHYVYILQGYDNKYYTGMTGNIDNRMTQHNKGLCKSTKYNRPLTLIWATIVRNRITARRLEKTIKNYNAHKFLLRQKYKANRMYNNIII